MFGQLDDSDFSLRIYTWRSARTMVSCERRRKPVPHLPPKRPAPIISCTDLLYALEQRAAKPPAAFSMHSSTPTTNVRLRRTAAARAISTTRSGSSLQSALRRGPGTS